MWMRVKKMAVIKFNAFLGEKKEDFLQQKRGSAESICSVPSGG